jgi:hypothetical protein
VDNPQPQIAVLMLEGGELYLFFGKAVQTVWEQERSSRISAADRNWP